MFCVDRRRSFPLFLCLIFTLILIIRPVFADEGSEGKRNNPLVLISSSPLDGAKDIPVQTEIILNFSKNIAHMTVRDGNIKCFSLVDAEGKPVQADIVIADNQIEPEKRRDVHLRPLHDLEPGVTYTVIVAPSFQSKSEVKLGEELKISFTTAGDKTPADASKNKKEHIDNVEANQKETGTQQVSSDTTVDSSDLQSKDATFNQSAVDGTDAEKEKESPVQDGVPDSDVVESTASTAEDNELNSSTMEEQTAKISKDNRLLGKISVIVLFSVLIGFILYRLIMSK